MMSQAAETELLQRVWDYPLFAALYGRRSRRFGLGFEIAEGPFPYRSHHAPLPLDEFEEALLVAAGTGVSGIPLWDGSRPPGYRGGDGRTFGSTAHGRRTALFFTNDSGLHAIDPAGKWASKTREIETVGDHTIETKHRCDRPGKNCETARVALSAARQVSEDHCQDPLRSRNLETGKAGLGPEWARGVMSNCT